MHKLLDNLRLNLHGYLQVFQERKGAIMTINSPVVTVLLIIFAIIGVLAATSIIGMMLMHGGMLGMMGSTTDMAEACGRMMGNPS